MKSWLSINSESFVNARTKKISLSGCVLLPALSPELLCMKKPLFIFFLLFISAGSFSQEKLEREYRIKQDSVPSKALDFVHAAIGSAGIKWYGEDNLYGKAIEAKSKVEGRLYSIKFDIGGTLQDVEVLVDYNSLPQLTRDIIETQLKIEFSKYRVKKTQIQWLGEPTILSALIKKESPNGKPVVNYEITLKGTKDKRTEYYEFLINEGGEVIRISKIIERNSHNLIF